jgi:hypothetical protein
MMHALKWLLDSDPVFREERATEDPYIEQAWGWRPLAFSSGLTWAELLWAILWLNWEIDKSSEKWKHFLISLEDWAETFNTYLGIPKHLGTDSTAELTRMQEK